MRFLNVFIGFFMLIGLFGCANNPVLNGMRYDVDRYRANDMLQGEGQPTALPYLTGMRSNVDKYRALDLLPSDNEPSAYSVLSGMRRNVDEYRGLRLADGEPAQEDEMLEMYNDLEQ